MNKQFYVVDGTRFSGNVLYEDLGIKAPEFVASLPDTGDQWDPVTIEKLSELDADHIFLLNPEGEAGLMSFLQALFGMAYMLCKRSSL